MLNICKTLVRKYWKDLAVVVVVITAVTLWQERNLLANKAQATNFVLSSMDNQPQQLYSDEKPTLVYFFAPWCSICKLSINNLDDVTADVNTVAVALDYQSIADVEAFIGEQELETPVLLGNQQVRDAFHVSAYPTYYLLDKNGQVEHKSSGYSTSLGLLWRTQI